MLCLRLGGLFFMGELGACFRFCFARRRGHGNWRSYCPFLSFRFHWLACGFYNGSGSCGGSFGSTAAPGRWRRWWWRWSEWLEEFQGLGARAQLSVEQQHEHVTRNFWILGQLRRNQEFGHFRQRDALLHIA